MCSFKAAINSIPRNGSDFSMIIHASKIPTKEYRGRYNIVYTGKIAVLIDEK